MGSEATAVIKPCCLASAGFVAGCARDPEGVGSSLCRGDRIGRSCFAREPWPEAKGVASHHPSVLPCGRSCPPFCDEFNLESSEVRARSRWFVFMTVVFFFRSLKKNCGDWCSALIGQFVVFAHLDVHLVVG